MNSGDFVPQAQAGRPPSTNAVIVPTSSCSSSSAERYLPQFKRKVLEFVEDRHTRPEVSGRDQNVSADKAAKSARIHKSRKASQSQPPSRMTIGKRAKIFRVHPTTISDWIHEEKRQHERQQLLLSSTAGVNPACSTNQDIDDHPTNTGVVGSQEQGSQSPNQIENELIDWLQAQRTQSLVPQLAHEPEPEESAEFFNGRLRPRSRQVYTGEVGASQSQIQRNEVKTLMAQCKLKLNAFLREFYIRHNLDNASLHTEAHERKPLQWLQLWCRRILDLCVDDTNEFGSATPKRIPVYPTRFKMEMVEYGKRLGQRNASRLFCISQRRIFDWASASSQGGLLEPESQNPTVHQNEGMIAEDVVTRQPGKFSKGYDKRSQAQVIDAKIEDEVFNWVQSKKPMKVTSTQIRDKARQLYREHGYSQIQCSYGWYRRWCKRFALSTCPHDPIDEQVLTWLLEQYDNNTLVTYKRLQEYTREIMNKTHPQTGDNNDSTAPEQMEQEGFKASPSWATRFFKRNHLLINWQGHYNKELPKRLELASQEFLQCLKLNLDSKDQTKTQNERILVAMDEIPLTFAATPNCVANSMMSDAAPDSQSGAIEAEGKISRLRKMTIKNCEATVKLAITNNGEVLSPMIVVKGQQSTNWDQVYIKTDNPVVVYYSKSTEPTVKSLEKWMDLILTKEVSTSKSKSSNRPPLLLWDSYSLHSQMNDKCKKVGIESRIFPAGCSCKLQPVNVIGRQLLLRHIEEEWTHYIEESNSSHCSRINLPSTDDIVDWVHKAFRSMKQQKELLKNSFKILNIGTRP